MKIIKNKKLFGLFNLFDILFIGLVLLLLVGSYYRYNLSSKKELFSSDMNILYTGYVNKISDIVIDNINIGDYIYMVTNRENTYLDIGKITDIELIPYKDINSDSIEVYDMILTVSVKGNKMDDDYLSHTNVELHVGNNMPVVTHDVVFNMEIKNIGEV